MKKLLALGIAILTMTTSVFAGTSVNVKVNDKDIKLPGEENRIYFNSAEEAEEYGYKKHTCIK